MQLLSEIQASRQRQGKLKDVLPIVGSSLMWSHIWDLNPGFLHGGQWFYFYSILALDKDTPLLSAQYVKNNKWKITSSEPPHYLLM